MSIKDLIENGYTVVLDTNVLLNIYRYSPEFSDFALECLKTIKENIILPATVRLEYEKHSRSQFIKMETRTEEASKETEKQIETAKRKIIDSCHCLERLQFQNVDELKMSLSEKIDAVQCVLEEYFEEHAALGFIQHSWSGIDYLKKLVLELDSNKQVMDSPSQEDIYRWCEEGERRYKKEIPPGYKDAKKKDGVRKYSDLILWQEIIRYSRNESKNLVFITDDAKSDWWEYLNGGKQFHSKLFEEFKKTGNTIVPMTILDFFSDVSKSYNIDKTDAVEIALRMTDKDYCVKIEGSVFESVETDLVSNATKYIDSETANIGSEGIEEFDILSHEFVGADRVERDDTIVFYEFVYTVKVTGTSFEYWGRDEDTREIILSNGREHVFEGEIIIRVEREAEIFYDFEDDNSYESAYIVGGNLKQTYYSDKPAPPGELGYCPICGTPLEIENDGGNGFCVDCASDHD